MPAKSSGLRGDEEYYCDIVEVGTDKFYVREMDDDTILQQYFALTEKIVEAENARRTTPSTTATAEVLKLYKERTNLVVVNSVVKWEGYGDQPATPENIVRLSPATKTALFRVIEKHSLLNYEEQDFSEPPPAR